MQREAVKNCWKTTATGREQRKEVERVGERKTTEKERKLEGEGIEFPPTSTKQEEREHRPETIPPAHRQETKQTPSRAPFLLHRYPKEVRQHTASNPLHGLHYLGSYSNRSQEDLSSKKKELLVRRESREMRFIGTVPF